MMGNFHSNYHNVPADSIEATVRLTPLKVNDINLSGVMRSEHGSIVTKSFSKPPSNF